MSQQQQQQNDVETEHKILGVLGAFLPRLTPTSPVSVQQPGSSTSLPSTGLTLQRGGQISLTQPHYARQRNSPGAKTIYPRVRGATDLAAARVLKLNERPITSDVAENLREMLFGLTPTRKEWLTSGVSFREPESEFAYLLVAQKNCTKGLVMCLQGEILNKLLFHSSCDRPLPDCILRPNRARQLEAFTNAVTDIWWRAGDRQKAVVCLPKNNLHNDIIPIAKDGLTEKLFVYELNSREDLFAFVSTNLYAIYGDTCATCLLLLYGLILTRGYDRIKEEMAGEYQQLLKRTAEGTTSLLMLTLTGVATPYLHNGLAFLGSENTTDRKVLTGVTSRSDVGLLMWTTSDVAKAAEIGSCLKTPQHPVWVTFINGHYGVLFNPNRRLICDYHAERRFDLHYYSSAHNNRESTVLSIDTRFQKQSKEHDYLPELERLILTKWQDAQVDWNGTTPYY